MLHVTSLSCLRGGRPVLDGVSFDLQPGQGLILRGPNGVGKTTLLRTIAGLQPPLSGDVEGADNCAFAGHLDAVKPALSVTENLNFWADLHGRPANLDILDRFGLAALSHRPAHALSAGQRRRLGLARLAVSGCRLWLLDEPTVALDTASVQIVAHWLRDHLAFGGMAVVATHLPLGLDWQELDLSAYPARARADEAFL